MPYGTEAMATLRIEKGHVVIGPEPMAAPPPTIWARRARQQGEVVRRQAVARAACFGGRRSLAARRIDCNERRDDAARGEDRRRPDHPAPNPMLGHVTSWCFSPNLDAWIALALVANGRARHGETLWALSPLADAKVQVQIGPPCFIDPNGERLRA
jgi:sarcosine oxidase subunit alpha